MSGNGCSTATAGTGGPPHSVEGETGRDNSAPSISQASSTPAVDCPPGSRGVKHKAKRTSRARLIASLTGADAGRKSAQVSEASPQASAKPSLAKPDLDKEASNEDGAVAVAQDSAPSPVSDPKSPHWQPTPPPSTSQRSASVALEDPEQCAGRSDVTVEVGAEKPNAPEARGFDASAFDALIYGQPSASRPPPGVFVSHAQLNQSSSEEERLYIHADPRIHGMHNRSEKWHEAKAKEIQERGNRKYWFGRVAERRRWLKRVNREKELAREHGLPGTASDPEPWGYSRVIDFEDVPESRLPTDVLRNPDWLKACTWFRENREAWELADKDEAARRQMQQRRATAAKLAEEETNSLYKALELASPPYSQARAKV